MTKLGKFLRSLFAGGETGRGLDLPDSGRSSEETLGGSMSLYAGRYSPISPIISFEMLETLKRFYMFNPDFSQYVANIVNLGNPGHNLAITAKSDSVVDAAITRANEAASRLYSGGAGVDGLFNQYLTDIAWSGGISSEDVVNISARRVEKVVNVPIEKIRFKYNPETDAYEPYQKTSNLARRGNSSGDLLGLIPLHPETYRYYALSTIQNSPYAKPPATAAVEAILKGQVPIMENIQFIAQKVGLMGLVSVSVVPPKQKPNEDPEVYNSRAKAYIKAVRDSLQGGFKNGLLVAYRDQKIEHANVAQSGSGVKDLNQISEEQVFSGLGAQPGLHGRTFSVTETFADVVYYLLLAQVANMQRLVKRRHERSLRFDFRLGGIDVETISLQFNKAHSRNAKEEAETNQQLWGTVFEKVKSGLMSPDAGAQEMGEESWFDAARIWGDELEPMVQSHSRKLSDRKTIKLSFDKASQSYRYVPEVLLLAGGAAERSANVLPIDVKKKTEFTVCK